MSIGDNIKKWREMRNLKQSDLAELVGVSDKTVSSWEVNRTEPKMGMVEKISVALNCKKTDIIGISENVTAFPAPLPAQIAAQYGEDMRELVEVAAALDHDDRVLVRGEVLQMLRAEKYRKEKAGSAG